MGQKRNAKLGKFSERAREEITFSEKLPTFEAMQSIEKSIRAYLLGFLVFEVLCFSFMSSGDRFVQMQWVNFHHSLWADYVFQGLSALAEIASPILIFGYFYWKKRSFAFPFLWSYAISTAIIQAAKHFLFPHALRPFAYFKSVPYAWHLVDGVFMNEYNSLPSGHTSAAWFMCFWLVLLSKSRWAAWFFALLAASVAYARVYLFQHFPLDTAVGAFIGTGTSLLVYYFFLLKPQKHD